MDSGDQGSLENQGFVFSQLKTHFATQYVDQNTLTNLPGHKRNYKQLKKPKSTEIQNYSRNQIYLIGQGEGKKHSG